MEPFLIRDSRRLISQSSTIWTCDLLTADFSIVAIRNEKHEKVDTLEPVEYASQLLLCFGGSFLFVANEALMIRAPFRHGLQRCHSLLGISFISTRLFSIKEDVLAPSDYKSDEKQKPNLLPLFLVPLVWGTYSPIVKSMYNNSTVSPVLIFNILSYLVSFSSLLLADVVGSTTKTNEESITADSEDENLEPRVGIELGMYLFAGSTLQVLGITQVPAMKSAVLVQCTTIVVPMLESLLDKKKLSNRLWSSCGAALFGVLLLTLDLPETLLSGAGGGGGAGVLDGLEKGDLFILGATLFYSMHVVRLSKFAARTKPLKLARYKSGTELMAAIVSVTVALSSSSFLLEIGDSTSSFGTEIKEYLLQNRHH